MESTVAVTLLMCMPGAPLSPLLGEVGKEPKPDSETSAPSKSGQKWAPGTHGPERTESADTVLAIIKKLNNARLE